MHIAVIPIFCLERLVFWSFVKGCEFPVFESIPKEAAILRQISEEIMLETCNPNHYHVAQLYLLEENYEDALINIEIY